MQVLKQLFLQYLRGVLTLGITEYQSAYVLNIMLATRYKKLFPLLLLIAQNYL